MKTGSINESQRLFDLVRDARSYLHELSLISDAEYVWLCADAPMARSSIGGSPSARRLEDYTEMRDRIAELEKVGNQLVICARFACTDEMIAQTVARWEKAKESKS